METYKSAKNDVNNKLIFKLSQFGYALYCDLLFSNRCPDIEQNTDFANHLKHGDKVFITFINGEMTVDLEKLLNILRSKQMKVFFYLMYEPVLSNHIVDLLLNFTLGIFLNNNVYEHHLVHTMPIGIRDCESVAPMHRGFHHRFLYEEGLKTVGKEYLCLMCYSYTHGERYRCDNALEGKSYVTNLNANDYERQPSIHCGKVPVWINYEYTHKSVYVLSPRGAGEDCHRFYEAIYLDCIPIVKRTNTAFDKLYTVFPCIIVNDWSDVTENLLINNKETCQQMMKDFKTKYPNAFTDLDSIHELLLLT